MKDYNGFTSKQRDKAQRWLNQQWAAGTLVRPIQCVACGQDKGVIDAHAEDYSEPFRAGVTDGFHLCFTCHMMVHCRHKNQKRWSEYRRIVEVGIRSHSFLTRNWPKFQKDFLGARITSDLTFGWPKPERQALLEIELSQNEVAQRLGSRHFAIPMR